MTNTKVEPREILEVQCTAEKKAAEVVLHLSSHSLQITPIVGFVTAESSGHHGSNTNYMQVKSSELEHRDTASKFRFTPSCRVNVVDVTSAV